MGNRVEISLSLAQIDAIEELFAQRGTSAVARAKMRPSQYGGGRSDTMEIDVFKDNGVERWEVKRVQ